MASLTVFGSPMTKPQINVGNTLLGVCKQQSASTIVMQAIIFAAIFESTLGVDTFAGGYYGVLQGSKSTFSSVGSPSSPAVTLAEATAFCNGGSGYRSAVAAAGQFTDPGKLAAYVEQPDVSSGVLGGSGYGQYFSRTENSGKTGQALMDATVGEAVAFVRQYGGGGVTGSTAGVTNSTKNSGTLPFFVGSPSNPNEDVWTAINRLAQERQWYIFSDGESLFLADGATIMQQTPALTLDRWADLDKIVHLDFTWDNTAFQYVANHKKKRRIVRKTQLAKVSSPVEATLDVICDIDAIRAGDVIMLSGCGPGDGKWLVGDCRRSVFQIYSELTLVPAVTALTESQAAGGSLSQTSNADIPGSAASASGSGTAMAAFLSAAATIAGPTNNATPFVSYGGRSVPGTPSIGKPGEGFSNGITKGYDAPGCVGAVLAAGGWWSGPIPDGQAIITQLLTEGSVIAGAGSGNPEFSFFIGNGQFFIRLNGRYWGSWDGQPIPAYKGGKANVAGAANNLGQTQTVVINGKTYPRLTAAPPVFGSPTFTNLGGFPISKPTGGSWLQAPSDLSSYAVYHFAPNLLGDLLNNAATSGVATSGAYVNPLGQVNGLVSKRVDQGVDYLFDTGSEFVALGQATIKTVFPQNTGSSGWPGGSGGNGDGGVIVYELTDGPYTGKFVYLAEDVVPVVTENQSVTAGEKIATYSGADAEPTTGIEIGWASGVGTQPLAQVYNQQCPGVDAGNWTSAAGNSFNNLLISLQCQSGRVQGAVHGDGGVIVRSGTGMPAGYP